MWTKLQGGGARLIAVLDSPVRAETDLELRLANLVRSFSDTLDRSTRSVERSFETFSARDRLDSELSALAKRSGAERAAVFDVSSPMVWGASLVDERVAEQANQRLEGWINELRDERLLLQAPLRNMSAAIFLRQERRRSWLKTAVKALAWRLHWYGKFWNIISCNAIVNLSTKARMEKFQRRGAQRIRDAEIS